MKDLIVSLLNQYLLNRRTVADVMKAFHKSLNDLDKVYAAQQEEFARHNEAARKASEAANAAAGEAIKAQTVANKLKALVSA